MSIVSLFINQIVHKNSTCKIKTYISIKLRHRRQFCRNMSEARHRHLCHFTMIVLLINLSTWGSG